MLEFSILLDVIDITYVVDDGRYISSIRPMSVSQVVTIFQWNVPAKIIVYLA